MSKVDIAMKLGKAAYDYFRKNPDKLKGVKVRFGKAADGSQVNPSWIRKQLEGAGDKIVPLLIAAEMAEVGFELAPFISEWFGDSEENVIADIAKLQNRVSLPKPNSPPPQPEEIDRLKRFAEEYKSEMDIIRRGTQILGSFDDLIALRAALRMDDSFYELYPTYRRTLAK